MVHHRKLFFWPSHVANVSRNMATLGCWIVQSSRHSSSMPRLYFDLR